MPERLHYIAEWAKEARLTQVGLAKLINADKVVVWRWINQGMLPKPEYLEKIADLLDIDVQGLFCPPDDYRLLELLRNTTEGHQERAFKLLRRFREMSPAQQAQAIDIIEVLSQKYDEDGHRLLR